MHSCEILLQPVSHVDEHIQAQTLLMRMRKPFTCQPAPVGTISTIKSISPLEQAGGAGWWSRLTSQHMKMQRRNVAAVDGCAPGCTSTGCCSAVQGIVLLFNTCTSSCSAKIDQSGECTPCHTANLDTAYIIYLALCTFLWQLRNQQCHSIPE